MRPRHRNKFPIRGIEIWQFRIVRERSEAPFIMNHQIHLVHPLCIASIIVALDVHREAMMWGDWLRPLASLADLPWPSRAVLVELAAGA